MPFERCSDCNLLHEQWSENSKELSSDESSLLSMEDNKMKEELARCPRCRLLHSFACVSFDETDIEIADLHGSLNYLDNTIDWTTFLVQAHSTKNLDWICSWSQAQGGLHESSHVDVPSHPPTTLVSRALQFLDDAGYLDFNIQDPYSLEVALTRIGAVDQIPVDEPSLEVSKITNKVSSFSSGSDTFLGGDDSSCRNKEIPLTEILEQALTSLTPIQKLALDVMFDTDTCDWLSNSLVLNFERAISRMNPLQSLAVAVKAGFIDMKSLPKFVNSEFITRNTRC